MSNPVQESSTPTDHLSNETVEQRIAYAASHFERDETVRTLFESFAEGLVVVDQEGTIILVNKRLEDMTGYSRDELRRGSLDALVPERFAKSHRSHLATYFRDPHIRPMGEDHKLAARRKDGTEFPVEISLSFLKTRVGTFGLAFVSDITRRFQAEQALLERNQALDAFARTVAHELNASLGLISGYSHLLLEDFESMTRQEVCTSLEMIAKNSHKMSNIINELLLLASMRRDDVALTALDMARIVDEALVRLRYQIEESGAQIILPEGSYPQALGYAPWVEEVWYNYISNGIKYGGEPPRLELGGTRQDDGRVRFWIKDNGVGLAPEQQVALFEPLTRLEHPKIDGHGLGLSIVRRIVERLDGEVGIESQVGQGSIFSFTLPGAAPGTGD